MNIQYHAAVVRSVDPLQYEHAEDFSIEHWAVRTDRLGIDDARAIVTQANQRPANKPNQLLIVCTNFITLEAQNALLKILEEPPLSTSFLFVLPLDFRLLPTLASRFSVDAALDATDTPEDNSTFSTFLSLSYKDRLSTIEQMMKKADHVWQRSIKQGLISYLQKNHTSHKAELEFVARTLLTRGASNKMLLEQAALTLPVS